MYKALFSLLEVHTESLASWSQISSGRHRKLKKKIHKKITTIMLGNGKENKAGVGQMECQGMLF